MAEFTRTLNNLLDGNELGAAEMGSAIEAMLRGKWSQVQVAAFLVAMRQKGVTAAELAAAASCLMEMRVPVEVDKPEEVLDTAGTGGDGKGTFNVSTAASFVAAACGARVAKHGNRAMSGSCGSSDLLTALGAKLDMAPEQLADCLEKVGICFLFAPVHHPALKQVAPVRMELGTRTIFNLLGPLVNPAKAGCRLAGVYAKDLLVCYAETFAALGVRRAVVVHADGMDEFSVAGKSSYVLMKDGKISEHEVSPADVGLDTHPIDAMVVKDIDSAVAAFNAGIEGSDAALGDAVAFNAGAALLASGKADSLEQGVAMAKEAIEKGKAKEKVAEYLRVASA